MSGKRTFLVRRTAETGRQNSPQGKVIALKPEAGSESSQQLYYCTGGEKEQQPMLGTVCFYGEFGEMGNLMRGRRDVIGVLAGNYYRIYEKASCPRSVRWSLLEGKHYSTAVTQLFGGMDGMPPVCGFYNEKEAMDCVEMKPYQHRVMLCDSKLFLVSGR